MKASATSGACEEDRRMTRPLRAIAVGGHRLSALRLVGIGRPTRSAAADRGQAQFRVRDALSGGEIRRVSREASRAAGAGNACGILAIPQARPPGRRVLDQNLQSIARGLQAAVMNETHAVAYLAWINDLRLRRDEQRAAAPHPCAARRRAE